MSNIRISATKGYEEVAKENYSLIRALANHAAKKFKVTMDDVVCLMTAETDPKTKKLVGLRAGSFNNYCRTGVVSEYAVSKLFEFFDKRVSHEILTGKKNANEEPSVTAIIFATLMDKIYHSSFVKYHLDGTGIQTGYLKNLSFEDYVKILVKDIKEDLFSFPDDGSYDLSEIEKTEDDIDRAVDEKAKAEDINGFILHYGLDGYIHENEEFIAYIEYETLTRFDLPTLYKCREDYRTIMEIFDAVIKFKEAKLRPTQTI